MPEPEAANARGRYRPWAELLKRTFAFDVLACGHCGGRLRLVALVTEAASITRCLRALGEPTEPPSRAPPRGPPYWARSTGPDHARRAVVVSEESRSRTTCKIEVTAGCCVLRLAEVM